MWVVSGHSHKRASQNHARASHVRKCVIPAMAKTMAVSEVPQPHEGCFSHTIVVFSHRVAERQTNDK